MEKLGEGYPILLGNRSTLVKRKKFSSVEVSFK